MHCVNIVVIVSYIRVRVTLNISIDILTSIIKKKMSQHYSKFCSQGGIMTHL